MDSANQPTRPSLPRNVAIITNAANQIRVSQAVLALRISSQSSTPVSNSSDRPIQAVVVALRSMAGPNSRAGTPAHMSSISPKTPSVMNSEAFIGPSLVSSVCASSLALGVILTSGGKRKYRTSGITSSITSPGTSAASAHWPQVILIAELVALATRSTIRGLGAVAVMNMAEVMGLVL